MLHLSSIFGKTPLPSESTEHTAALGKALAPFPMTELRALTVLELTAVAGGPELQVGDGGG